VGASCAQCAWDDEVPVRVAGLMVTIIL
jgi:hypothetical protein